MPYQGYADGLYLMARKSPEKGVEHYGIIIIIILGNIVAGFTLMRRPQVSPAGFGRRSAGFARGAHG